MTLAKNVVFRAHILFLTHSYTNYTFLSFTTWDSFTTQKARWYSLIDLLDKFKEECFEKNHKNHGY